MPLCGGTSPCTTRLSTVRLRASVHGSPAQAGLTRARQYRILTHATRQFETYHTQFAHLMLLLRPSRASLRRACFAARLAPTRALRLGMHPSASLIQSRDQHNKRGQPARSYQPSSRAPDHSQGIDESSDFGNIVPLWGDEEPVFPTPRIRYFRSALWALVVSGGIFCGLSYLEAKKQLEEESRNRWIPVPQWTVPRRGPTTPTSVATTWWAGLDNGSKLSTALIGVNVAVHASSFVFETPWLLAWHVPARNVNYTMFTSMFVHAGAMHIGFNMYALSQFMPIACNTRLFEGNLNHMLAFYLSTGIISGFAQHLSTLLPDLKNRGMPSAWIRCGGASGALFGLLGVFCTQYPTAGLGIMFLPFSVEAQYFLPAIMLFDLVGMIRGYSFISLGHGVSRKDFPGVVPC